jgi:hypothetical protein
MCREEKRLGSPGASRDARAKFQETGQEQRLARMAGVALIHPLSAQTDMDVGRSHRAFLLFTRVPFGNTGWRESLTGHCPAVFHVRLERESRRAMRYGEGE